VATFVAAVTGGTAMPEGGGFDSLEGVMRLFTSRAAVFSGWVHYVCFDLLAGRAVKNKCTFSWWR
jgi:hypothetical protein